MPDRLRNRLLMLIGEWSPKSLAFEAGKRKNAPRPKELLDGRSLVKWETSDPENPQGREVQLVDEDKSDGVERLRHQIEELKARKADRLKELNLMMNLTANLTDVLTEAVIVPAPAATLETDEALSKGVPMRRDDEVEATAMDVAMRYERSRGWTAVDVTHDGEHYDIRSEGPNGEKRFIEVKERARSGAIVLTGREVDKLRELGERAWLYIVTFWKGERPRLRIIQDPISKVNPEVLYRRIQFVLEENDWGSQGEEMESLDRKDQGGVP